MIDWTSGLGGFLVGVATGACGSYFANKYTDRRREIESTRKTKERFLKTRAQMPELLSEVKADLAGPDNQHVRDLFVLPHRRIVFNAPRSGCLVYYEDQHPALRNKLAVLENMGYIINATCGNTPKYRMTEEFVELVQRCG